MTSPGICAYHRWDYERPSKYWPGAFCVRCRDCRAFRVVPPDAAVTVGRPAEPAAAPRPAVTGAAGDSDRAPAAPPKRREA